MPAHHPMFPETTHDELSRQDLVKDLRKFLANNVMPNNRVVYEHKVLPNFQKQHGRSPENHNEVRNLFKNEPYYRMYSALQRASQEIMWESIFSSIERQLTDLLQKAEKIPPAGGSLHLNSDLAIPKYHTANDIHLQPGAYHTEFVAGDITAGAAYDCCVNIYGGGAFGELNDDIGWTLVDYVKRNFPDFKPKRILDMGCTAGHSTIPWVDSFPEAEVNAIDVAAPVLRYAYARAEALKSPVHFHQMNAERTDFKADSFDLVISHVALHETSNTALRNIFRETYRLLKTGGIMAHLELPQDNGMDPFDRFMQDWEVYNNNEEFMGRIREIDFAKLSIEAGFGPESVKVDEVRTGVSMRGNNSAESHEAAYPWLWPVATGIK